MNKNGENAMNSKKDDAEKKVYALYVDDTTNTPVVHTLFSTKEKARECFEEILANCFGRGWKDLNGHTYEECLEKMYFQTTFSSGDVYTTCVNEETVDEDEWFD